jgi:Tfp pilus assembly protein PilO
MINTGAFIFFLVFFLVLFLIWIIIISKQEDEIADLEIENTLLKKEVQPYREKQEKQKRKQELKELLKEIKKEKEE